MLALLREKIKACTANRACKESLCQVATSEGDRNYTDGEATAMSGARARVRGGRVHSSGRRRAPSRTEGMR